MPQPVFPRSMLLQNRSVSSQILSEPAVPAGNGLPHAVHLTTAAVKCLRMLRVDLNVRQWYQKQAGLVGFFLLEGAGFAFPLEISPCGDECEAWSLPETGSPLTSAAPGLN